jgi:hypothetical protein
MVVVPPAAQTGRMPTPGRKRLGEALITTTLWSIYLGSRGAVLAIAAAQGVQRLAG